MTVAAVADAFLEWCRLHRSPRTFEWYRDLLQRFLDTLPKGFPVRQLRPLHVQTWVDGHPRWSASMKRACVVAVQRAFNWATKLGYIDRSPVWYIEKPKATTRETVVSRAEFDRILSHSRGRAFRDLLVCAWETGARELLSNVVFRERSGGVLEESVLEGSSFEERDDLLVTVEGPGVSQKGALACQSKGCACRSVSKGHDGAETVLDSDLGDRFVTKNPG